jgi:hypothetical protein
LGFSRKESIIQLVPIQQDKRNSSAYGKTHLPNKDWKKNLDFAKEKCRFLFFSKRIKK